NLRTILFGRFDPGIANGPSTQSACLPPEAFVGIFAVRQDRKNFSGAERLGENNISTKQLLMQSDPSLLPRFILNAGL
ncbi:hypothetical protein ABTH30_24885, partial [Acinetobacter baumannii]